jgi:hypothetical protein
MRTAPFTGAPISVGTSPRRSFHPEDGSRCILTAEDTSPHRSEFDHGSPAKNLLSSNFRSLAPDSSPLP